MSLDELRRVARVSTCCRVYVRERLGVWSGITEDFGSRGCRIVTPRLPRLGTILRVTLSSDLFPEELEVTGETVWATSERLGVLFVGNAAREGALSPSEWMEQLIEHGAGSGTTAPRVAPVILHAAPRTIGFAPAARASPRFEPVHEDWVQRAPAARAAESSRPIGSSHPWFPR
jgi:hypothetical protein